MDKEFPKMELDLAHIAERETVSFEEKFRIPSPGDEEMECVTKVAADVTRTGSRYLMRAGIDCTVRTGCSRCLELFDHRFSTGFDLVFQRGENVEVPEGVEDDAFILLTQESEYSFDIFPRVREAVLLELPIRYLCRNDCAGICQGCGRNLNTGSCGCENEEGDPRWGPLKNLLKDKDDN